MSSRAATIRTFEACKTYAVVGDVYRFLATGKETGGRYAMWEAIVPPGGGPPPHIHTREEEGFVVLEGEITFQVSEERIVAKAGTFAHIPIGTPHSFKNESNQPAKMIITVVPAGLEEMFFELSDPIAPGTTNAPPPNTADIEKILQAAPRYGVEMLIPNL